MILCNRCRICALYWIWFLLDGKCFETGIQYYGGINARGNGFVETYSVKHCQLICETTNNCNFFTFNTHLKQCLLRRTIKGKVLDGNVISGRTNCEEKGMYHFDDITSLDFLRNFYLVFMSLGIYRFNDFQNVSRIIKSSLAMS